MHTYFIFLTASFLLSSEATRASFWSLFETNTIPSIRQINERDSSQFIDKSTCDGKISALNHYAYHTLCIYSLDNDYFYDRKMCDDACAFSICYIQMLEDACEDLQKNKIQFHLDARDPDICIVTTAIMAIKSKDIRKYSRDFNHSEKFVMQAAADITKRYTPEPHAPIEKNSSNIIPLKNIRTDRLEAVFKANPQEFYKELIPTLRAMNSDSH